MGFNLKRRMPTNCTCSSSHLTEKRIKEVRDPDTNKSIVTIVDADLSLDVLPDYDAFPLEAQLSSGVPLNQVNPTLFVDKPQNVDTLVDNIISFQKSSDNTDTNQ